MSSSDNNDPHPVHPEKAARLGLTLLVDGEVRGKEDLVVEGQVLGKINLPESDLLIAGQGRVEAEIRARNITIRGEVIGNVEASGLAVIERTGRMKGNLSASVISVEDGAQFKGSIKVLNKA
jgi:cytoskeletal protein CcmA (bactofilin family)